MLPQLRHPAREWTRSLPHRSRALSTLDHSSQGSSHALPPPPPSTSSLPPQPGTPSQLSIDAYAFPSAAEKIQPTLDIPPESDPLLAYLTSHLMHHGKRHAAARRTSRMLLHLHAMTRAPPLPIFRDAVLRAAPSIRLVSQRKGGKNVQKPVPLGEKQRTKVAIRGMLEAAWYGRENTVEERLARQVLAIIKGTPEDKGVLKEKKDLHTRGMVNRGNVRTRP